MQQDSKDIRQEYAVGFANVREALQQHVAYCLYHDFDQIRHTDMLTVQCLHCSCDMHVRYADIATTLFCKDCKDADIDETVIHGLQKRLSMIRHKLLSIDDTLF